MSDKKYIYPRLSSQDWGWFRLSGAGLANTMFVAARAYINAKEQGLEMLSPTWRKWGIGPWLRGERDKRVYSRLFYNKGISGFRKLWILKFQKSKLVTYQGNGVHFVDLEPKHKLISEYFRKITRPEAIAQVPNVEELKNCIAVHVRMGDYSANWRIPIEWFKGIIENAQNLNPKSRFLIFSDGTDEELAMLTALPNTERVFYGNAYADMVAISRCKMLVASDSTFSCWGAFLGRVPTLFYRRNFPSIFSGNVPEEIIGASIDMPEVFKNIILGDK
ncbi:alpha-1,2-fucosyltransferase [Bacteroides congonensis]|uniref:alpha-1,2-fucosyltransferase n=1 Tax=Bacteroides congonensis TaxID=1871006 RepID=UPI0018A00C87|nr:alpha-1,2-fucosyltransferase [Bacteroides congonensis]